MFGWACWRFNIAVQVQQQEQEVFYTINVDPRGHRYGISACRCDETQFYNIGVHVQQHEREP